VTGLLVFENATGIIPGDIILRLAGWMLLAAHEAPFIAIIREVLWNGHDLVMITAENRRSLKNVLFGTTTMHLMRKCPCPVWVMKPDQPKQQKISWPLSIQPHLMRNGTLLTI
jgi:hypothetical protein